MATRGPKRTRLKAAMALGAEIARLRKKMGWTQKELGARLHVGGSTISNYEQGIRCPEPAFLRELAREVGTRPTRLLQLSEACDRWDLSQVPAEIAGRQSTEFVGRQDEEAALRAAWARVVAGGVEVVQIVGEPRIGKTELVARFAHEVVVGGGLVTGGTFDGQAAHAYEALATVVGQLRQACPRSTRRRYSKVAQTAVKALARLHGEPADVVHHRAVLAAGVRELLAAATATSPLLVVLENLHAAREDACALLADVLHDPPPRLLLVVTYHATAAHTSEAAQQVFHLFATSPTIRVDPALEMTGLGEDDLVELARRLAAGVEQDVVPPDDRFRSLLLAKSDGNPFLAENVLLALLGCLDDDVPLGSPASADELELLPAPKEALAWHDEALRALSPLARTLLDHAAAAGLFPDPELIAEACEQPYDEHFLHAWDELVQAELIDERSPGVHQFRHGLIREALRGRLRPAAASRIHLALAIALEARWQDDPESTSIVELADHWAAAKVQVARAKAVEYGTLAVTASLAQAAADDALQRCRDLLRSRALPSRRRAQLKVLLGEAQWRAGLMDNARATFRSVGSDPAIDADVRADAAIGLGRVAWRTNASNPDFQAIVHAIRKALPADDIVRHSRLVSALGRDLKGAEPRARIPELHRLAIELAQRAIEPVALAEAYSLRAEALLADPDTAKRTEAARQMLHWAQLAGDPFLVLQARTNEYISYMAVGALDRADRALTAIEAWAEEQRLPLASWVVATHRTGQALFQQPLDEAAVVARIGDDQRRGVELGHPDAELFARICFGYLLRMQGHLDLLEPFVRESIVELDVVVWDAALALGLLEASGDREADAREQLAILEGPGLKHLDKDGSWVMAMCFLAETYTYLGSENHITEVYEELLPWREHLCIAYNASIYFGSVQYHLGMMAARLGEWARAEDHFDRALRKDRTLRSPIWQAHTLSVHSQMLEMRGATRDRATAERLRDEAAALAREYKVDKLSQELAGERRRHLPAT